MRKLTEEQIEIVKEQIKDSVAYGNMYPNTARFLNDCILQAINYTHSCKKLCECVGNERVVLDCTMKPCKHPKYYNK